MIYGVIAKCRYSWVFQFKFQIFIIAQAIIFVSYHFRHGTAECILLQLDIYQKSKFTNLLVCQDTFQKNKTHSKHKVCNKSQDEFQAPEFHNGHADPSRKHIHLKVTFAWK